MTRGVTLTAAQLSKLMKQAPAKLGRVLRVAKPPEPKEDSIEKAIVQAMVLDGWRPFKMEENFSERKKKKTGEPGMCDHLFIRYIPRDGPCNLNCPACDAPFVFRPHDFGKTEVLWWEFKASKKVRKRKEFLSKDQVAWVAAERARGALIWVAGLDHEADTPGAAQHYLNSGLARNRAPFEALLR